MALPDLRLTTAATCLPVSLAQAKAHLRVDHSEDDTMIAAMVGAAVGSLDGKAGLLFRCLTAQIWTLGLSAFPSSGRICLPLGPVKAITGFTYIDAAGSTQTVDALSYDFYPADGLDDAYVAPKFGTSWPGARASDRSVSLSFAAGYSTAVQNETAQQDAVPPAIRQALLLMVGDLYRVRESQVKTDTGLSPTVEALLAPYRRYMV